MPQVVSRVASFGPHTYDVVVVGGGIAGSAFAASLVASPRTRRYKVALLEASAPPPPPPPPSPAPALRCVALSPHSITLLQEVGAWNAELQARCTPYKRMNVSDWFSRGFVLFDEEFIGSPTCNLGVVAENMALQRALAARLAELHQDVDCGVEVITGVGVQHIEAAQRGLGWPKLHLADGRKLQAPLLVGADGAKSVVKKAVGIGTQGRAYGQMAVVASLAARNMQQTAWQRFLPSGPIALLPFGDEFASLVWTLPTHDARRVAALPPRDLVDAINTALHSAPERVAAGAPLFHSSKFSELLSTLFRAPSQPPQVLSVHGQVGTFPLFMEMADSMVAERTALLGDAAHRMHPMAGQGLNLGLTDAATLSDILTSSQRYGQDLGNPLNLEEYNDKARRHAKLMVGGVDAIKSVFEVQSAPFCVLRNIGMDLVNAVPELKAGLARLAMGI